VALRQDKLAQAVSIIEGEVASGAVSAAALHVKRGGETVDRALGLAKTPGAVFLIASLTKPMTAAAVMLLADRGALRLEDPVRRFIPEFQGGERERVTVRHLLTHTSGLPDMLPENEDLRRRHAPLKDFVAATCRTPLLFSPGAKVEYQSMGILLAAEIVERIAHRPLAGLLKDEFFKPLKLADTSLDLGGREASATMQCQVDERSDWDWNSSYWRNLGAPWGGAHSTAPDLGRWMRYFAEPDQEILKAATVKSMITNQTQGLNSPWGLGWMIARGFGNNCSPQTFGHSGSTGTLCWLDPDKRLSFVLLSTRPSVHSQRTLLRPVSDLISQTV
jgi:CubicO group peptidase (beta-lactamase class C family)